MSDNFQKLQGVMSSVLDVPASVITPETRADDLENWDSLGQMNLMLALEEEFGVSFTPEQITGLLTVPDIVAVLDGAKD